jgi:hypothetical protein
LGVILLLSNSAIATEITSKQSNTKVDVAPEDFIPVASLPEPISESIPPTDNIELDNSEEEAIEQVTSVSQLLDVQPTDWAFQALQSLVERYGCIEGYPNTPNGTLRERTFRGNRAITRYEFAAGLNACLQRITQIIPVGISPGVSEEDLAKLQQLQSTFATELANLPQRIDNLEASLTRIQAQQFSTTTVLNGEILFAISGVGGKQVNGNNIDTNIVLSHRTELTLNTSFFGKDVLRARLAAQNNPDFANVTGTNMARLSFTGNTENDVLLGALFYRYPVNEQLAIIAGTTGLGFGDFAPTLNPYINSSLLGNVSAFSGESPIYALNGGSGIGLEYRFSRAALLSLGYLPFSVNVPDLGMFKSPYGAIAQLTLFPTPSLSFGLTYIRSYKLSTGRGSLFANDPFDGAATSTNTYGLQASYQVTPRFSVSGWAGLINAHAESNPNKGSDAKILTWAVTFALPDLGKEGNLAGFIVGQPPKTIENDVIGRRDRDTSLHLEAFYRYQITNNISVTPGFFVITNPEHNANNGLIYVGTIRTSFVF